MTNPLIDSILHDFYFGRELSDLAERALRETGATGTAIALKRGELFVCCASAGETAPDVGTHVDSSAGLTGACIRDAVTTICDDTRSDARLDPTVCEELGIASVIAVPIVQSGATVGVIEALSSEPHAFGPEQQALLETLAGEIQAKDFSEPWTKHEANDDAVSMASLVEPEHTQDAPELPTLTLTGDPTVKVNERNRLVRAALVPTLVCAVVAFGWFVYSHVRHKSQGAPNTIATTWTPTASASPQSDVVPDEGSSQTNSLEALERAARKGDTAAQMELARKLAQGDGIGRDPVMACAWYTLANLGGQDNSNQQLGSLSRGLSNAQIAQVRIQVGQMFANGIGVKRDVTSAYHWFLLARAAGSKQAAEHEQELADEMSAAQLKTARERANAWLVQHHLGPLND